MYLFFLSYVERWSQAQPSPPLLIMVLAEREKRRENDRESLMVGQGCNTARRWLSTQAIAVSGDGAREEKMARLVAQEISRCGEDHLNVLLVPGHAAPGGR